MYKATTAKIKTSKQINETRQVNTKKNPKKNQTVAFK